MRLILLSLLAVVALSQEKASDTKKPVAVKQSPTEAAATAWQAAEAQVVRLQKESDTLAAEWQNRQVQIREAKLQQKESELILQSNLCAKGQRVKMVEGKPVCETPPMEKRE